MKNICLYCGDVFIKTSKQTKFFCSPSCRDKINKKKPFTIAENFEFFKRIVEISETAQDFNALFKRYFSGGRKNDGARVKQRARP